MSECCGDKTTIDTSIPATVIILAYNTPDLLLRCLRSFYDGIHSRGWQIIVVDNGSDEDIRPLTAGRFDAVEVIRSECNLGFAAGNNLGLRRAKGDFVILINSDVIARAETLESLVSSLSEVRQAAAMSPGLLAADGSPQAFAFGLGASPGYLIRRGVCSILGFGALHDWSIEELMEVEWVSAACLCVRRNVVQQIGELDERFPLYFEDTDWCMRMRAAGWKVLYNPQLTVIHLGGATEPHRSVQRQDLYYRSLVLFCGKHYGRLWQYLIRALLLPYRGLIALRSLILGNTRKIDIS